MALAIASTALTSLPTRSTSCSLALNLAFRYMLLHGLCSEIIFINFQRSLFGNREFHRRISPSGKLTTCLPGRSLLANATKGVSSVCQPLPPDRPLWFPGSSPPEWLDGRYIYIYISTFQLLFILVNHYIFSVKCSLPGDFGFDPLGLGMCFFILYVAGLKNLWHNVGIHENQRRIPA